MNRQRKNSIRATMILFIHSLKWKESVSSPENLPAQLDHGEFEEGFDGKKSVSICPISSRSGDFGTSNPVLLF